MINGERGFDLKPHGKKSFARWGQYRVVSQATKKTVAYVSDGHLYVRLTDPQDWQDLAPDAKPYAYVGNWPGVHWKHSATEWPTVWELVQRALVKIED